MINKYKAKKENAEFIKNWNFQNRHNNILPVKFFDIDRVKVGHYSYGALDLYAYNTNNKKDILQIGNFVSIASGVKFFLDEQHQSKTFTTFPLKSIFWSEQYAEDAISKGSIVVDDEVWIGANSTIMSGVYIGKGSIIATGSVVVSDVPSYSIVGGVPAKVIKYRFEQKIIDKLMHINLIDIPKFIIEKNIDLFYKEVDLDLLESIENLLKKHKEENESTR